MVLHDWATREGSDHALTVEHERQIPIPHPHHHTPHSATQKHHITHRNKKATFAMAASGGFVLTDEQKEAFLSRLVFCPTKLPKGVLFTLPRPVCWVRPSTLHVASLGREL